ncbi:MAG: phage baseplate protein [Leptolyngbya sp. SIO1D8]|nr:phage baseplate protein [Leptolyngbya sp. SIO1D8]
MRPLTPRELLQVWEQGLAQPPVRRALALLAAASPELSSEQLAAFTIGQRDGQLLTLREWTFGSQIESVAQCPHCGETLELSFNVNDIRVNPALETASALQLQQAGYQVRYRLPTSQDLAGVSTYQDASEAQETLLARCLLEILPPAGQPQHPLPDEVVDAVIAAMAAQDPQADVELALTCPSCQHQWLAAFDIVTFFWHELNTWARRLLVDVHRLARAYGWSEAEILALSPLRRQFYLEMVGL